ncbi:MAG TPA: Hsp20/alpha crystallin family protein [Solirubrobacteraceae bacterium]|jgi:HSP20 family protein|nr:Hsp20/alpha crystallin family protein [Solirubrobacteraceae bacterium]
MALIRWEPARELRLLGTFFDSPTAGVPAGLRRWVPSLDVVETDDHYVVKADLPGLSEGDVKIEVDGRVLTISGERREQTETKEGGFHRIERASGSFARALTLPQGVDATSIQASFSNGVLEVRVPKPAAPEPHRVAITAGETPAAA